VSIDGEYSGKIFDTDLSVVPGDLYTMALSRPRVTCRRYTAAETAKPFEIPLIVVEPPTPTPSEIDQFNWHW